MRQGGAPLEEKNMPEEAVEDFNLVGKVRQVQTRTSAFVSNEA